MNKDQLRIAKPCSVDWARMTPADRGRFCADCKKVVRDLSTMTEPEARVLLRAETASGLCVRFVYDQHGKVFFGGGQPVVSASFLNRAKRVAAAAALALPLAAAACSPSANNDDENWSMGDVAYVEPDAGPDADATSSDASVVDAATDAPATDADVDADPDGGPVPIN